MFLVDDIYLEAKNIVGICDDNTFFRWVGDAVELIANKLDNEGQKGYLDICTAGCSCSTGKTCNTGACCGRRCVSLPREVDTVIAVNICGQPALGFGQLFSFHLNGPGDFRHTCDWSWYDMGRHYYTYRDLITPSHLVIHLERPEDNGKQFVVFGYDVKGNVLRRNEGGTWKDGILIPTVFGYAIPDAEQPLVARITAITKDITAGSMRLATVDSSGGTGVNIGVYEADQRIPQFRRIQLNRACDWVRVAYRKSTKNFSSRFDHIPLISRTAFIMAMQARKQYAALQLGEAMQYEATAARLELEAQQQLEPPTYNPIQVVDRESNLRNKGDYDIR